MSELGEIRAILYELKEDSGATRASIEAMEKLIADRGTRLDGLDRRMRAVENRSHWYAGISAAVGAILGFSGTHFPKF